MKSTVNGTYSFVKDVLDAAELQHVQEFQLF